MSDAENVKKYSGTEPGVSAWLHSKGRRLGKAVSGSFELTSRCNFNCKMCYIHSAADNESCRRQELSAAQWLEIAKQAQKAGVLFILFTGGEPLLREDFPEIYTELKKMGFVISVNSNGSLIKGEIRELFRKSPPFRLNVTLYGAGEESYKELCSADAFPQVLENLRALKEMNISTKINCCITKYNCHEAEKILALSRELGFFMKATSYMYPQTRQKGFSAGENPGRLSADKAAQYRVLWDRLYYGEAEFKKRALSLLSGLKTLDNECAVPEVGGALRCRAGSSSFWINWQGFMSACGLIPDDSQNVLEKGFENCFQAIREKTAALRLPAVCSVCSYRNFCNICAAVAYSETGACDKKPEYVCRFSRRTAELMQDFTGGSENR